MKKDKKKDNDLTIIFRHLIPELRPYTWRILGSLSITGLVIGADLFQPYCFKWLLDAATVTEKYPVILQCLLLLLGLAFVRTLFSYWEIYTRSRVGEAISAQYRRKTFEHVLHLPLATLHDMEESAFEHRIMHDCGEIGRVYVSSKFLPTIANIIQTMALTLLILVLSWQVGLVSILVFPIGWLISQRMARRSHTQVMQQRTLVEQGHAMLQEIFSCIREVRAVGNEAGEIRRWDNWLHRYGSVICRTTTQHQFVRLTLTHLIHWIGLCIVFGWGGWQLLQHQLTVGSLLALSLYIQQLYTTLTSILSGRIETGEVANSLEALAAVFRLPREWPDQGEHTRKEGPGKLEFAQVSFSYKNGAEKIQNISFTSDPEQMSGIVGPTGSGKSTLMNLCMRFYEPTSGKIFLDGQDIAEIAPHALRQQIGLVSQDIQLWNTTIRENLVYGLHCDVTWEHVLEVCQRTCVHEFVQRLPEGYETVVGSRGIKLSGGEKQRIALARTLLRNPTILLLDEATSALDSLTETAIMKTLLQEWGKKNRILVAHRLATVQEADQIIVIENGKIVEMDAPQILCHQNGLYAKLYHTQQLVTQKR
ncbi:ABC transporter ATP-binding protein [Dictyobacter arantiisoli]|uniref:ABC transporter ATP-binding protein n=1 Tax=Dictyobacter arantiisoli TaxID=2014874 RepID=A0A5A5THW6_9CHLR|nr:ABC transporter ATP-binding protein [Dictyobacter arantiisoli]GCF11180.1 ABC transporter ATP-binding protein [Dictyobacter arantiisoli]